MRHISTPEQEDFVGLKFLYRNGARRDSPLIVLVHGRAGTREVIWTFERSVPAAASVVSLQAFVPDPLGGFSWWDMESSGDREIAIGRAAQRVAFGVERVIELFELAPKKVYAVGFSQGAALLATAALTGSLSLDGLALLAGFVPKPEKGAQLLSAPDVFAAHGTQDEVVTIERARRGVEYLRGLGLFVTYVEDDVGHKVGIQGTRELKKWMADRLS
jgi:phospholipase/carboxylesterase